ncbi:MAG TPA: PDZ domain-containing protein [Candidatus Angelobacter sp.]|nr:PDZ domain-containing protein [Candidatus Angelobacter sp.]
MSRVMTTALLLAGLALPAISAEMQPESPSNHVSGYFYAASRSYLGVDIQDITADRVNALKLKEERGVEITMVDGDAPAAKAGLREHDVILDFNGTAVQNEEQLRRLIREVPPGRTVSLGISRDGNPLKVDVQLADQSKIMAQSKPRIRIAPPRVIVPRNGIDIPGFQIQIYSVALGVQTENLTQQLGEYFGVKDGEGVLIRSVEKTGAAGKAGLKAGDIIVRADNEKLTDGTDLSQVLRKHRSGGKLSLLIMRDKHEQTITVTLPDRGSRDSSFLVIDDADLQASIGNISGMLENLDLSNAMVVIDDNMASVEQAMKAFDGKLPSMEISPELEKALRQAGKALEQLNTCPDPI